MGAPERYRDKRLADIRASRERLQCVHHSVHERWYRHEVCRWTTPIFLPFVIFLDLHQKVTCTLCQLTYVCVLKRVCRRRHPQLR